jgi:antitoxin component YwqK of YwqJK toxin-antitoxin module
MNLKFPRPVSLFCITTLTTAILLVSCGPKKVEVIQNYGTGEISRKHYEINGKKEGKMIEYYKDGKIKGEREFKNDIQVNKSVFYYPSGKLQEVQYHDEGKLHGGDTVFYETGQPQFLRNFNHGLLDGYLRKWAPDGTVIFEAKYKNDTLVEVKGESVHPDTLLNRPDTLLKK